MNVTVRLFAGLRELAGTGRRELALPDGATVADVWPALGLQGNEPDGLLYAVNREYAEAGRALADGDEVGLIPPVSGGADDLRVTGEPLSLDAVVAAVSDDEAGAVSTFTGTVRRSSRGRARSYTSPAGSAARTAAVAASVEVPDASQIDALVARVSPVSSRYFARGTTIAPPERS